MADLKELQTLASNLKTENESLSTQIQAIVTADNYLEAIAMQKEITELTKKNEYLKKTLYNLQNNVDITNVKDKAKVPVKEK